jgi:phosphotransferase system IIB component
MNPSWEANMTFSDFLRQYGVYMALVVFTCIVLLIICFLVIPRLPRKEKETEVPTVEKEQIIALLGGSENIKEIALRGSRLSVTLKDQNLANIDELKKHGVDRVIVMQTKLVLLVNKEVAALFDILP